MASNSKTTDTYVMKMVLLYQDGHDTSNENATIPNLCGIISLFCDPKWWSNSSIGGWIGSVEIFKILSMEFIV